MARPFNQSLDLAANVCEASREGKTSIYKVDLETRAVRAVVADPAEERTPSWSRDGLWIYFASKRSGSWQIEKVPAAGGTPTPVTTKGGFRPLESSDSKFVYYVKGNDVAGIWRVPNGGGEERLILDHLRPDLSGDWAVTGDGICFLRFDQYGDREGALWFYDFATHRVKEIAKLGRHHILGEGFTVSADGRSILYSVWEHPGGDVMLVENFR